MYKHGTKEAFANDINEWMQRVCKDPTLRLTRTNGIVLKDLKRLALAVRRATDLERKGD